MVILHYMFGIPPVRGGGLVRYATDLMVWQKKLGEQVLLLIPGALSMYKNKNPRICRRKPYQKIPSYEIKNPLPVPMRNGMLASGYYAKSCDGMAYRIFLQHVRPSVIHVHTLMGLHREFFAEASKLKIPIVFTTHDYFGICPTASMLLDGQVCSDVEWKQCKQCCQNAYPPARLWLEHSGIYQIYRKNRILSSFVYHAKGRILSQVFRKWMASDPEPVRKTTVQEDRASEKEYKRLREFYMEIFGMVSYFHFNSSLAKKIYESRLGGLTGNVLTVSHSGIRDLRKKRKFQGRLTLGYLGNKSVYKGYGSLMQACECLYASGRKDFEVHLYTGMDNKERKDNYVVTHPYFGQDELMEVLDCMDVLVVPSQWPETFGMVVLEAVSHGVPVIVSENVGAKEILDLYTVKFLVYDGTQKGLEQMLQKAYDDRSILEQANMSILEMKYDFSYRSHVKEVLGIYRRLVQIRR
ncbi:MAG: glycosyltransferase [Eubacterium sp.]|nr:glycosyltransferase [Eubacterium sp.]